MIEIAQAIQDSLQRLFAEPVCGYQVERILLGNPPVIDKFPAICIELLGNDNAPLTLGTFSQEHHLRITVWADTTSYLQSYLLRSKLATMIESSLFRTVFPVIQPYCSSSITQYLMMGDKYVSVSDPSVFSYPYPEPLPVYLDNGSVRYPNWIIGQMDDTTFQLDREVECDFPIENTIVIRPRVHVYDAMVNSVDYGDGNQNQLLLMHATINYSLKIARVRYQEPYQTL